MRKRIFYLKIIIIGFRASSEDLRYTFSRWPHTVFYDAENPDLFVNYFENDNGLNAMLDFSNSSSSRLIPVPLSAAVMTPGGRARPRGSRRRISSSSWDLRSAFGRSPLLS